MTSRRTLGLCCGYIPQLRKTLRLFCVHIPQLITHSIYLKNTVYFAVMLQASWNTAEDTNSQQVHISSHDGFQNFITSTLLIIGLRVS